MSASWRKIRSAPKDGTPVCVWNEGCGYWIASFRLPDESEPYHVPRRVKKWRDSNGKYATATNWHPLHPLPENVVFTGGAGRSESSESIRNAKAEETKRLANFLKKYLLKD